MSKKGRHQKQGCGIHVSSMHNVSGGVEGNSITPKFYRGNVFQFTGPIFCKVKTEHPFCTIVEIGFTSGALGGTQDP